MTIFNDLSAAVAYARAYEDSHRADDGGIPEHEMMNVARLDDGRYAVANIHWLYELSDLVQEIVPHRRARFVIQSLNELIYENWLDAIGEDAAARARLMCSIRGLDPDETLRLASFEEVRAEMLSEFIRTRGQGSA